MEAYQTSIVPKGYTRFYFNYAGECNQRIHEVFFDCITRKSAVEEWHRWVKNKLIIKN